MVVQQKQLQPAMSRVWSLLGKLTMNNELSAQDPIAAASRSICGFGRNKVPIIPPPRPLRIKSSWVTSMKNWRSVGELSAFPSSNQIGIGICKGVAPAAAIIAGDTGGGVDSSAYERLMIIASAQKISSEPKRKRQLRDIRLTVNSYKIMFVSLLTVFSLEWTGLVDSVRICLSVVNGLLFRRCHRCC